jgi:hypothetical protein
MHLVVDRDLSEFAGMPTVRPDVLGTAKSDRERTRQLAA